MNEATLHSGLTEAPIKRRQEGAWRDMGDTIAPEVRVSLYWPGREPAKLWAFPKDLDELALGFAKIEFCATDQDPAIEEDIDKAYRLAPVPVPDKKPAPDIRLNADALIKIMRELIEAGGRWDATGCFHRAGAYNPQTGRLVKVVEDIGRHNCIDRLAGWALKSGASLEALVLVITARATASLAAKAAAAGFPALVSRSAVTTAAVTAAKYAGMTLAGFTREKENRTSVFVDPKGLILP
jgi:FdhD protein